MDEEVSIGVRIFPDESRLPAPYLQSRQAQRRAPTDFENLLGDALEAIFAAGIWDVEGVVARLNADGIRTPEGDRWTPARFESVMADLGRVEEY